MLLSVIVFIIAYLGEKIKMLQTKIPDDWRDTLFRVSRFSSGCCLFSNKVVQIFKNRIGIVIEAVARKLDYVFFGFRL